MILLVAFIAIVLCFAFPLAAYQTLDLLGHGASAFATGCLSLAKAVAIGLAWMIGIGVFLVLTL